MLIFRGGMDDSSPVSSIRKFLLQVSSSRVLVQPLWERLHDSARHFAFARHCSPCMTLCTTLCTTCSTCTTVLDTCSTLCTTLARRLLDMLDASCKRPQSGCTRDCLHIVLSRTWTSVEMLAIQLCLLDACIQGTYRTGQSPEQGSSVHEYLVIGDVNAV